jgi:hypothetical protein
MWRIGQAVVAAVLAVAALAACTTPGTASPTAPASASPLAAPLAAGVYVEVATTTGYRHLYELAPGGSSWRYVADIPRPKIGQDEELYSFAPDLSRFLLINMDDNSLWSVLRSGGDRHPIVTPPKGQRICGAGFDPAADRVWYAVDDDARNLLGVYAVAPDGTGHQQLSGLTGVADCDLVWSADGSTMVLLIAKTPLWPPPASAYHKVKVVFGNAAGRDVVLALPDTVRAESVLAVSADGRTAVVSTEPIDAVAHPLGRQMWLADLGSGSVRQITLPKGSVFEFRTGFQFEPSGLLLVTFDSQISAGKVEVVGAFDQQGQYTATLPNPSTDTTASLWLWAAIP